MNSDSTSLTFAHLKENLQDSTLARLALELRLAMENCPQCQGRREKLHFYRGRENLVPCVRCEPLYQLLGTLARALEIIRGDAPY